MRLEIDEKSFRETIDALLSRIADEIVGAAHEEIIRKDAIAKGILYRSIQKVRNSWRDYDVGSDCPYAAAVEYGQEPHRPPFKNIYEWVQIKLGIRGEEAESVAWRIVKKIEREGVEAKPFLMPAIMEVLRRYG